MRKNFLAFLACLALGWSVADASPAVEADLAPGVWIDHEIAAAEAGISVRGSVCRRAYIGGATRYVRAEAIGPNGQVRTLARRPIRGAPGYRGGCGYYALELPVLGADERLRLRVN